MTIYGVLVIAFVLGFVTYGLHKALMISLSYDDDKEIIQN